VKDAQSNAATKKLAAMQAARMIEDGMVVGIGTGSTMVFAIEELARRMRDEGIKATGIPTSFQSRLLCVRLGIPVREMQDSAELDLAIDGADEVDPSLCLIKGGGAAMAREKITVAMAKQFVVVVDESKLVSRLGERFAIPVEVLPPALGFVERVVARLGGESVLRMGLAKDGPVVTDNGQFVLDVRFPAAADLRGIDGELHRTPGVVETGLFFDLASKAVVGGAGTSGPPVRIIERPSRG
jgi:ribose 5-phosphate isomerase A